MKIHQLNWKKILIFKQIKLNQKIIKKQNKIKIAKSISENFSGRNDSVDNRKKNKFSVILKIKYNHKSDWIPNDITISNISQYPNEEERIFQTFTFYKVVKVDINTDN